VRDETVALGYGLIPIARIERIKTAFILRTEQKNGACASLTLHWGRSSVCLDF